MFSLPLRTHKVPLVPHFAQIRRHAAVRHGINAAALGTPPVDEEVGDRFLGRPDMSSFSYRSRETD